ncbi:hypothetical protein MKX83_23650 [Cytobacillus sp. FSL M8-0252]|uniref:hypothetical protein n=1 Tax=Cytobacillus sp. FSL M8-0252 TaxID=2921621 RepID=UPI0030F5C8F0
MKRSAIIYAKGYTQDEAAPHLEKVRNYCLDNGLAILEVLYDETSHNLKDLNCLRTLYEYMSSKKVSTVIFVSCLPYDCIGSYIYQFRFLAGFETLKFHNGLLDTSMDKARKKKFVFNQTAIDEGLSVDFGNLVEVLSQDQDNLQFINREENARLLEEIKWKKQEAERDFNRDKGILGIVFDESNKSNMAKHVSRQLFIDKSGFADAMVYSGLCDLKEVLESKKYYKVVCDLIGFSDIDDLRDFILTCEDYVMEVQFDFGDLSSRDEYELLAILDELTGNA